MQLPAFTFRFCTGKINLDEMFKLTLPQFAAPGGSEALRLQQR